MSAGLFPLGVPRSKRLMDLALAVPGLVVISPLLALIAALVWLKLGPPIFFRQLRPGYRAKPFAVLKFRTMTEARDEAGHLLPDDARMTGLGRVLRSLSLDDLPNLLNVVQGEMSIVGPRPLLMQYLGRYSPEQARRHDVLPGVTGWAQVNGRNALTWEDKFRLDVWYVDHWSLWLDVKILMITIWKVTRREGITQEGQATAEEFMGSEGADVAEGS